MPNKNEQDHLLDHTYDGIQEFDNPMPRGWVYIFWATIVFSLLYWLNVPGVGNGKGRIANYNRDMAAAADAAARRQASEPAGATPEQLAALASDPAAVALGKKTFDQNCAACHRSDGGGQIAFPELRVIDNQISRRIGANSHETRVADRELSGEAGNQV